MLLRCLLFGLATTLAATPARADFSSCKEKLKGEAVRAGISPRTAASALDSVTADPKVLDLENIQPEFKTPIWDYLAALVDDERVRDGRAAMAENAVALAAAERRFGVSKYILAAIWGVELDFGRADGKPAACSIVDIPCVLGVPSSSIFPRRIDVDA